MTTEHPNIRVSRPRSAILPNADERLQSKTAPRSVESLGNLKGLGPLTRISTSFGDMHAQALRERDMVRTRSGGFVKIERVERIVLDEEFLRYHPEALPIRIRAGAFGRNLPAQDVLLAPFQAISSGQPISGRSVARAADALGRPSVMRVPETIITYTLIRCARPVSVLCEGLWVDV